MSMMLSDSSTQVSGGGILFHDWRETGPTMSSKQRALQKTGQLKFMLRRRGIHGLTYLGSICPSLYLNEVNEVVGSQLSITAGLTAAVNPLRSSHSTWTMNS